MQAIRRNKVTGEVIKSGDKARDNKPLWLIYPDFWDKKWGEAPCLGQVYADDEFEAIRKAYDKNLLRVNFTFGPKPVRVSNRNRFRHKHSK